eukprot:scaffold66950_cov60-Phaeocystis_antarctica.AAC.2
MDSAPCRSCTPCRAVLAFVTLLSAAVFLDSRRGEPVPAPSHIQPAHGPTVESTALSSVARRLDRAHGPGTATRGRAGRGRGRGARRRAAKEERRAAKEQQGPRPGAGLDNQPFMQAAIGRNLSTAVLIASCPSRNYEKCYYRTIEARYPVAKFRTRRPPGLKKGVCEPADDPSCLPIGPDRVVEWFGGTELPSPASCPLQPSPPPLAIDCRQPPTTAQQQQLLLLVGVPSSPTATGTRRRAAIRAGWMRDERVGRQVAVCFLLSSLTPQPQLAALQAEAAEYRDVLLLDAPETGMLLRNNTRYSGYSKKGRGMPTFKQYRFFQHAAQHWAAAPFVAKFDDDTAPSLRLLLPLLASLHPRCEGSPKLAFVGAVNWAGVVPRAEDSGVRLDRCGFGWGLRASLHNYGTSFGTRGSPGHIQACDLRGAALPLPYATGAGYIFSQALLRWVATDPQVVGWVAEAGGPDREALQWQKFEDTSTAYWLTYSPATVQYVDIGPMIHDAACHVDGARKRARDGTYRCALAAAPFRCCPIAATP